MKAPSQSQIPEIASSRKILEEAALLADDVPLTPDILSTCLQKVTSDADMPAKFKPCLRAIGNLLRFVEAGNVAEAIAKSVTSAIAYSLEEFPVLDSIKEAVAQCRIATSSREDLNERLQTCTGDLISACARIQSAVDVISQSPASQHSPPHSYAQAANTYKPTPPPRQHDPSIPKRQILVEGPKGEDISGLEGLTEKQLTAKASEAIRMIKEEGNLEVPEGITFMGAVRLRRGGVVYRLNSVEATEWLQGEAKLPFIEKMGGLVTIKDRTYTVLVNFVPVTFDPTPANIRVLELSNHLSVGSIINARFIKPAGLRRPGQNVATMYIDFKTPQAADLVISQKMFIENKLVHPMKKTDDAHRCYKCQKVSVSSDHNSINCKSDHDTCGYCGKEHRTKDCTNRELSKSERFCTNCNTFGHGPGDRQCPTYIKAKELIIERKPEQAGRYFQSDSYADTDIYGDRFNSSAPPPTRRWTMDHC